MLSNAYELEPRFHMLIIYIYIYSFIVCKYIYYRYVAGALLRVHLFWFFRAGSDDTAGPRV